MVDWILSSHESDMMRFNSHLMDEKFVCIRDDHKSNSSLVAIAASEFAQGVNEAFVNSNGSKSFA